MTILQKASYAASGFLVAAALNSAASSDLMWTIIHGASAGVVWYLADSDKEIRIL